MDISFSEVSPSSPLLFTLEGRFESHSSPELHSHDCHQLLRFSRGTSLMEEENFQQPLFSHYTAFIPKGRPHRSLTLGGPVTYKSIYLDPGFWDPGLDQIRIFNLSDLGRALFHRIRIDHEHPLDHFQKNCLDLLFMVLDREIHQAAGITRIPLPKETDNARVGAFIAEHYAEKLSLEDFSKVVNTSPRHLSRRFKADTGLTLFHYLRQYRILKASVLLSTTDLPVSSIGFEVGYESLSSFYRDFKSIFSLPPKTFRNSRCRG